jgi:hypothetical protein
MIRCRRSGRIRRIRRAAELEKRMEVATGYLAVKCGGKWNGGESEGRGGGGEDETKGI